MKYLWCLWVCVVGLVWLGWPNAALSHESVKTSVTFDREISRILTSRCIHCHSDNNLTSPLTTYEQTRPWARAIEEEVLSREMPPWRAVPGYGRFANDGGLTTRELQTIVSWVEGNGPRTPEQTVILSIDQGGTTPESLRLKPDLDRWQLGQPDLVRRVTTGATEAPQHTVVRALVDMEKSARHVQGLEFRPDDRRALRAAFFWLEATGQWLGSWTPWHGAMRLPDGVAYRIPAGSRIVMELHYQGGAERAAEVGQLGVHYAPGDAAHCPADIVMRVGGTVPPHATNERFQAVTTLEADTTLLALVPTLPDGAHSFEVRARRPEGSVQVLLLVRDILHDWPTPYVLAAPVRLSKGSQLSATVFYRNSRDTPGTGGVDLRVSAYRPASCSEK
jgi:hypothetical protein